MEESTNHDAFERALDYLYSFIDFEQRPQDRYMSAKLDDSRPKRFMDALGAPYDQYPTIHIAGTKGKGSVAILCATTLQCAGYKVGLFTSPHLQEFRERIRILTPDEDDGRIPKNSFTSLMGQVRPVIDRDFPDVTWFEILTAVAFLYFAQEEVDVAVIEVGLGGRLDSTNVVTPLVSVISSLSLDHTKFLGDTLPEIAAEKGGIIKPGIPVISAKQKPEAMAVLKEIAVAREAPLSQIGKNWQFMAGRQRPVAGLQELIITRSPDQTFIPEQTKIELALAGDFQLENATLALAALQVARPSFPAINLETVLQGFKQVQWHGRLQIVHAAANSPTLLADCAHNPDSADKLCQALTHHYHYDRLWVIFGSARDKDIEKELDFLLPPVSGVVTTTVNHPRSATPEELAEMVTRLGKKAYPAADMDTAVATAWHLAGANDLICVTGSIYIVGDLLNRWESLQSQLIQTGDPREKIIG